MRNLLPLCSVYALMVATLPEVHASEPPNFSGIWELDRERSDDAVRAIQQGFGRLAKGRNQMLQRYLAGVLVQLATSAKELQIEHTEKDITIFDQADNVTIYYIDGRKHFREDQDLGQIETVTEWNGNELVIQSKGKEVGEGVESVAMRGDQLVFSIRIKAKTFENEVVADLYYNRVEE